MRKNVGGLDAVIRVIIGLALLFAAAGLMQWTALSIGLVVISIPFFRTAFTGSCPVYSVLGIDTTRADERHRNGHARHHRA